jgi:hypothetical protein
MRPQDFVAIEAAHLFPSRGASVTLRIEVDGQEYHIRGEGRGIVDLGVPLVELCPPDSTPQNHCVEESAWNEFQLAAERLVREDRTFYSALRATWNLPNLLWERVASEVPHP